MKKIVGNKFLVLTTIILLASVFVLPGVVSAANVESETNATIIAHKIVCDNESDLPNWERGSAITASTAEDFVNNNSDKCRFVSNQHFQYRFGGNDDDNPGDHKGFVSSWTTFGPTDLNGRTEVLIDPTRNSIVWVREVFSQDYIEFAGKTRKDKPSAEMWCHDAMVYYNNYEYINPEPGETYYCVAFNVEKNNMGENPEVIPNNFDQCDLDSESGWLGQYYNHVESHVDMEISSDKEKYSREYGDPLSADSEWLSDWYDEEYYRFARVDEDLRFGKNFFPFDPEVSPVFTDEELHKGHNYYLATQWRALVIPNHTGEYEFHIESDDDHFIYLNGELLKSSKGPDKPGAKNIKINLVEGEEYDFRVFFAERKQSESKMDFYFKTPGLTVIPFTGNSCDSEPEPQVTLIAHKIVCENESDLPNWNGGADITGTTAQEFIDANPNCEFEEDWKFQYGFDLNNPGDEVGEAGNGWVTFGSTNSNGKATSVIDSLPNNLSKIWMREVFQEGYVGFTGMGNNHTSAEMWCDKDVLNYDNYDFIENAELGEVYNCVAFNALAEDENQICFDKITPSGNDSILSIEESFNQAEKNLSEILNEAGYDVNLVSDQRGYERWLADLDSEVELEITLIGNEADRNHAFGYYSAGDEDSFVPLFRTGTSSAMTASEMSKPIFGLDEKVGLNISNGENIGFGIKTYKNGDFGGLFLTENDLNPDEFDHSVVLEIEGGYVIALEDILLNEGPDKDYNDVVVVVKAISCSEFGPENARLESTLLKNSFSDNEDESGNNQDNENPIEEDNKENISDNNIHNVGLSKETGNKSSPQTIHLGNKSSEFVSAPKIMNQTQHLKGSIMLNGNKSNSKKEK